MKNDKNCENKSEKEDKEFLDNSTPEELLSKRQQSVEGELDAGLLISNRKSETPKERKKRECVVSQKVEQSLNSKETVD